MPRGGYQKGGGRPKGSLNRSRDEVRAIIEEVIPLREQFLLLAQLSRGVLVQDEITRVVYQREPNVKALNILVEHSVGRPSQAVDFTTGGESLHKDPFIALSELLVSDSKLKRTIDEILNSEKKETVEVVKPTNGSNGHNEEGTT